VALKRTGRPDVNLRLDLDMGGANKKLTGQVSQTITGVGQAVSLIDADRAEFSRTVPLLSPYVGTVSQRYNLITTPEPVANPANYPQGYSVASFTVFPTGKVTWTGRLADDTKISGSSALSKDRRFPLFVSLYGAKGCFASAVTLDVAPSGSDLTSTDRFWFRPAIAGSQWYPAGWSDGIVFGLTGAKYANDPSKPAASVAHWLAWDKGLLSVELKQSVTPTSGDLITKADPLDTSFSVSFKRSTGELSGSFTHPADGKATGYRATTLQKGSGAGTFGYFRTVSPKVVDGKGQAGSARLYPQ
jgi:hypothetical protein